MFTVAVQRDAKTHIVKALYADILSDRSSHADPAGLMNLGNSLDTDLCRSAGFAIDY